MTYTYTPTARQVIEDALAFKQDAGVIEDDTADWAEFIEDALNDAGFRIVAADRLARLLAFVEAHDFAIATDPADDDAERQWRRVDIARRALTDADLED